MISNCVERDLSLSVSSRGNKLLSIPLGISSLCSSSPITIYIYYIYIYIYKCKYIYIYLEEDEYKI